MRILLFFLIFFISPVYSLDINQSVRSTIENNTKVKIAFEKLKESKELIENAYGQKLPSVTSTISGTYSKAEKQTSTSSTTPETFTDSYKLTITQNLYDGGLNNLEIDRSKILYNNEILNFKNTVQDLILSAIEGYLTVINYHKSLEVNKKNYDSVLKVLEETKTRFNLGSATLYELQNSESSFIESKANLFSANQNLIIGKKTFKRIVGLNAIKLEDVVKIDTQIQLKDIEDYALDNNLSLQLIKNDIKNKEILLIQEKKKKKPNLDLTGTAEYSDSDRIDAGTETTKGTLALTLTIPIFQQGIDNSNIRKYQSQILQSELNLQDNQDNLLILISNTYKNFKVNESKMEVYQFKINASETALLSLKQEYSIGTKTISDFVEEEEKLLQAKVNFFNSKKDYLIAYFTIKSLEGTLLKNFQEYLPKLN